MKYLISKKENLNGLELHPNSVLYYQGEQTVLGDGIVMKEKTYHINCSEENFTTFKWAFNQWGYGYSQTLPNHDDITLVPVEVNGFVQYTIYVKSNNGFTDGWVEVDENDACKLHITQDKSKAAHFIYGNNLLFYITSSSYPTCKDVTLRTDSNGVFLSVKMYDSEHTEYPWNFQEI